MRKTENTIQVLAIAVILFAAVIEVKALYELGNRIDEQYKIMWDKILDLENEIKPKEQEKEKE